MEVSALIAQFRLDTRDTVQTYLWSDAEICTYIDEAQKQFCRLTGGLADATSSECARVALTAAINYADISPRVLKIRAAFTAAGAPLQILNFEDLEFSSSQGLQLFAPAAGTLQAFVVGMEPNKIFFTTLPAATETINLIVYRLPIEDIEDDKCDLEVDPHHHIHLLKWARHLAHLKPDAEAYDRGRSDQYGQEFTAYCEMAKMEKGAREHKYRSMQFSW